LGVLKAASGPPVQQLVAPTLIIVGVPVALVAGMAAPFAPEAPNPIAEMPVPATVLGAPLYPVPTTRLTQVKRLERTQLMF